MHLDWTITAAQAANLIAVLGLIVGIAVSKRNDRMKRQVMHAENRDELRKVAGKVDTMYGWFERNVINGKGWGG